jgi:rRNA-processing protein FCF1
MRFLLDTNFLLIPGKFRVDIFRELQGLGKPELFTLDLVVAELDRLASGRGRDSRHARLGLELIKNKGVLVLAARGTDTDQEIERIASERDLAVCTQDRALQGRLRRGGIPVIHLRQGRLLVKT